MPPEERPRQRFLQSGGEALSDSEVLSLVLWSGSQDLYPLGLGGVAMLRLGRPPPPRSLHPSGRQARGFSAGREGNRGRRPARHLPRSLSRRAHRRFRTSKAPRRP